MTIKTDAITALDIRVTGNTFNVGRRVLKTRAELFEAILASGATACHVLPDSGSTYEQVALAMSAVQDAGCSSGITGNAAGGSR